MDHEERGQEPRDGEQDEREAQQGGSLGDQPLPPGGGDRDEEAVEEAREKLDQAGGGH